MSVPKPTIILPETPVAVWTFCDTGTPVGLFAFRNSQAKSLLELPDFGGGDLDDAQRREALRNAVSFRQPLAALSLFLGVVALEDFIRDLATRLADSPSCAAYFPNLADLRAKPVNQPPEKMFKRLDTDPAGTLDPEKINEEFRKAIGVEPVPSTEFWHLRDLALLRHTVAHHGAVIRQIDLPRFTHFIVASGRVINPPPEFVKKELEYLWQLGREIEKRVRRAVFQKHINATGAGWSTNLPQDVQHLIELFAFFGYLESTTVAFGCHELGSELRKQEEVEAARIRSVLIQRCVEDLISEFGP